jgi:hypothetical protein
LIYARSIRGRGNYDTNLFITKGNILMNEWERLQRQTERYKQLYPEGTRVLLIQMGDDRNPVEPNTRGTVNCVDDMGTLHCTFDNGRILGIVPAEDSFRKLTQEEIEDENNSICVEENIENELDEESSGPIQSM